MGRLTVQKLLEAGHEVVLLNRGRTANPFQGAHNMRWVKCDRMADREGFKEALRQQDMSDVVIDFVGFQEVYLQDTVEALTLNSGEAGRKRFATRHYIFVSTDSVYWAQKVPITDDRIAEDDAQDFSPEEFETHLVHCQMTSLGEYQLRYGGNKLGCERTLEEAWRADGFPYTALRLPDVYGPFDNLGGFWDLVTAIEMRRPIPAGLQLGRMRVLDKKDHGDPKKRCFSWAFAEDVRDAIVATMTKGVEVHGVTMNVAHEEAVTLRDTAAMISEALRLTPEATPRFDERREAALPSTDYGTLDVSRALRFLRPWRPTPMRQAVQRSVAWFCSTREHRRYHRLVHREQRVYDDSSARRFTCQMREVPSCWVGAPEKAGLVRDGPVVLNDSLPDFTGQAVLKFMQRLMDQAGEKEVSCELQRGAEVERQTWALRHFAGQLLPQSEHSAAYRLENNEVVPDTNLMPELQSPLHDIRTEGAAEPPERLLKLGGVGARSTLRRSPVAGGPECGLWDCVLLGRRKWRFFPPETALESLCVPGGAHQSQVDSFTCGPDTSMVQMRFTGFAPAVCWECEQTMGDAVVVPHGWWYQTYDDDRTLSISARYGGTRDDVDRLQSFPAHRPKKEEAEEPEVIEFELVD